MTHSTSAIHSNQNFVGLVIPKQSLWRQWLCRLLGVDDEETIALKAEQDMIIMKAIRFLDPQTKTDLSAIRVQKIVATKTLKGVSLSLEYNGCSFRLEYERFEKNSKISTIPIPSSFSVKRSTLSKL